MALINPGTLLNLVAEAAKPEHGQATGKNKSAVSGEPFSRTLRQQMQQLDPGQVAERRKMSSAAARPAQPREAEGKPPQAETSTQVSDAGHTGSPAQANDSQPAARETVAGRKKRQEDDSPSGQDMTGPPAWMQTVMAMRSMPDTPVAATVTGHADAGAMAATLPAMAGVAVPFVGTAADAQTDDPAFAAGTQPSVVADHLPAAATTGQEVSRRPWTAQLDGQAVAIDAGQTVASMAAAVPGDMETIGQALAEQAWAANGVRGQPGDAAASIAAERMLPAAAVIPNSAWLNAAGFTPQAAVMTAQMLTPFGHERWQAAMNQHVAALAGAGDEVASLTLSPPDLGPIQVVLKVDNQSVNTSFITDNPLVRQALEDGMQDLRQRMQSQGLQLGQTFVGDGQQAQQHFESQSQRTSGVSMSAQAEDEVSHTPAPPVRQVALGRVDTFV